MVANPTFTAALAHVDEAAIQPLPRSRKIYARGSRPDIRVPMREIAQADTPASFGAETNPPIFVYDTSGPYTDPEARIDIAAGLKPYGIEIAPAGVETRDHAGCRNALASSADRKSPKRTSEPLKRAGRAAPTGTAARSVSR